MLEIVEQHILVFETTATANDEDDHNNNNNNNNKKKKKKKKNSHDKNSNNDDDKDEDNSSTRYIVWSVEKPPRNFHWLRAALLANAQAKAGSGFSNTRQVPRLAAKRCAKRSWKCTSTKPTGKNG